MLLHSIRAQMNIMFQKKTAIAAFYIMLVFVFCNYIDNVMQYRGYDVVELYQPVKLLLLSEENVNTPYGFFLMQVYPVLAILPAGFSLMVDKKSDRMLFLCSRVGRRDYYIGKIIAAICTTVIVFCIPLLLEVLLNYISFPKEAMGNFMNLDIYSDAYIETVKTYPFYQVYVYYPYLYAIGWILLFGITTGMLNVITIAVSTWNLPYKVLLFLPVYVILDGMYWIGDFFDKEINHFFFLRMFVINQKNYLVFYGIILGLFLIAVLIIMKKSTEDYLG